MNKIFMPIIMFFMAFTWNSDVYGQVLWNFDQDSPGTIPEGFFSEAGQWEIVVDGSAVSKPNVLAQLAQNSGSVFNILLLQTASYKNIDISVDLKSVDGQEDQGGGIVWRAQDKTNYYIARYNPLEDNYRVYKVVGGKRVQLQSANIRNQLGWHNLRVTMIDDHIECFYDGQRYLDIRDSAFAQSGKIGLWSKADAVSYFDDLTATEFQDMEELAK